MIRPTLALVLLGGLALGACDSGAEFGPPDALTRGPVPASETVGVTIAEVTVTVQDAEGRAVTGKKVLWSADAGGTAGSDETVTDADGVARTSWTLGTEPGTQTLTATIDALTATFPVTTVPDEIAVLDVEHGGRVIHALGDTLHVTLIAEDQYGNAVPESGIDWSSLDAPVATVATGVVTSVAEGTARIVATAADLADTTTIEVDQVVAGIGLSPVWPRVLAKSESLALSAMPVDSNGFAVDTTLTPEWSTSAAGVASVDGAGVVEAVEVGDAVITAVAGPYSGQAALEVKAGPRPTIATVSPAVVSPGDTLTITGTGFGGTAGLNAVSMAGIAATVLTASDSELTAVLERGTLPCAPTSDAVLSVTVDALEARTDHPLSAAERIGLDVGQNVTVTGPRVACTELDRGGRYVLSVFNAMSTPGGGTAFRLRGTSSASIAAITAEPESSVSALMDRLTRERQTITPGKLVVRDQPEERAHARILDMNIELLRRLGAPERTRMPAAFQQSSTGTTSALQASAVPVVGQILALRIPDIDANSACTSFLSVNARVVHVGQYGIVLEDTLAPLAGETDALWTSVGNEYDAIMHQTMLDYFGDPLVLDDQLDNNDRLMMLFSKEVNDLDAGVAGFVFSGDFYPRSQCQSSDDGEIFYGIVPTSGASGYGSGTADSWRRTMRSTVIHEVKHITSFASRIYKAAGGAPSWEASWLEEATARLSEEFYARVRYGYGHRDNTGYEESIFCEVRPTGHAQCGEGSPWVMGKHFFAIRDYYANMERLSPIGRVEAGDATFYGSGWLFVRWALDQSGQNEATFIRALVGEPSLSGVANLAARTGRSHADMLADFSLATAVDDRGTVAPADGALTFPGWDTRAIFQGLYDDFHDHSEISHLFTTPFPLQPRALGFGDFQRDVTELRGGTASLFELSGSFSGTQLIELLSASGGTAPASLGLAIVRIE